MSLAASRVMCVWCGVCDVWCVMCEATGLCVGGLALVKKLML